LLEALWIHQSHNMVNGELLQRMLSSADFRARGAATRVLCYWRDRVPGALGILKKLAADEHPRVRLEAVRAASFFTEPEAVEVPLISAEHPSDEYIAFTRDETMRALEPHWKKALADGKKIAFSSDAGARFFLKNVKTDELLKMDLSRPVALEVLFRVGVRDEQRQSAIAYLAGTDKKPELNIVLDALVAIDKQSEALDESVAFDLVRLLTTTLTRSVSEGRSDAVRTQLQTLATTAKLPIIRQAGYLGLIAADGSTDKAWELAAKSVPTLRDLVSAVPLISDPSVRASLYTKVESLLSGLPAELASGKPATKGTYGRFVRIELPRRGTLTLAEVEVVSNGQNAARQGKATQKNTAHGGAASRAIDGNTSDSYGSGSQTHSEENTPEPWWEIDLGEELPIESIAVYNRRDGDLWRRLEGFRLTVLDSGRNVVVTRWSGFSAFSCFVIAAFSSSSALSLFGVLMSTSGSMIGTRPAAMISLPMSNCCLTTASMPAGFACLMTDRILVPNTFLALARFSSAARSGIGFMSCTPSFSSAKPLSTFKNGTTPLTSQRYVGVGLPSMSRSMVFSNRIAPIKRLPENAGLVMRRVRMACTTSYMPFSSFQAVSSTP
jgi:hypothetical protein